MIRLRALRQGQNISMKQLGDIFGVAESTISLYEKWKVDADMLIKADIHADFCLTAKGDSMINARIYDHDGYYC